MSDKPAASVFDQRVDFYEALIDWPKRLANEGPFFRELFQRHNARLILDAACGTGRHAELFSTWGLTVEGADISPAMIEKAREQFGENERLRWVVRGFEHSDKGGPRFDAVVCIGNSLGLVADAAAMRRAIASMIASLRPGGVGIVQVLNLWAVREGPTIWQKKVLLPDADGPRILLKGMHRQDSIGYIDLIELRAAADDLQARFDSPCFWGFEESELRLAVEHAGGQVSGVYGDYQRHEYDRERSQDCVVIFEKKS